MEEPVQLQNEPSLITKYDNTFATQIIHTFTAFTWAEMLSNKFRKKQNGAPQHIRHLNSYA